MDGREPAFFASQKTFLPVKPEVLIVHDARTDKRFQELPLVVSGQVTSYIGSPIVTSAGLIMGTVCIVDNKPRKYRSATASFLGNCANFISEVVSSKSPSEGWALRDHTGKILFSDGDDDTGCLSYHLLRDNYSNVISASICDSGIRVPFVDGDDNSPDLNNLLIQRTRSSQHSIVQQSANEISSHASKHSNIVSHGITELGAILGRGGFGTVRECKWQGRPAALKQIESIDGILSYEGLIGCRLHHPNLLRYYSAFTDKDKEYLVLEICRHGSMQQVIDIGSMDTGEKPEFYSAVKSAALNIAMGLQKLHQMGMVHSDIKPDNVLLSDENVNARDVAKTCLFVAEQPAQRASVKISDFGLLHQSGDPNAEPGTITHMPPEAIDINQKKIRLYTDIYSFGVMLWEMLTLHRAWAGYSPFRITMKLLTTGGTWVLPGDIPDVFHEIVTGCTGFNWECRPDIDWVIEKLQGF